MLKDSAMYGLLTYMWKKSNKSFSYKSPRNEKYIQNSSSTLDFNFLHFLLTKKYINRALTLTREIENSDKMTKRVVGK